MPAEDIVHVPVRNALIKDGWRITAEPFTLILENQYLFADIGAERVTKAGVVQAIVVEVKGFRQRSLMRALEEAWGQYSLYQKILRETHPDYKIYLALPQAQYQRLQNNPAFRLLLRTESLALIVVNIENEEVFTWIEPPNTAP